MNESAMNSQIAELNLDEIESVDGGILPAIGAAVGAAASAAAAAPLVTVAIVAVAAVAIGWGIYELTK